MRQSHDQNDTQFLGTLCSQSAPAKAVTTVFYCKSPFELILIVELLYVNWNKVNKLKWGGIKAFEGVKDSNELTVVWDEGDAGLGLVGGILGGHKLNLGVGMDLRQQLMC